MNFHLTDEQRQFADSLARWLGAHYRFEQRRDAIQHRGSGAGPWRELAALGLFALTAPGDAGGFDGDAVDVMSVMQHMGAYLVVEPVLDAFVALDLLRQAPDAVELISGIATGTRRVSVAFFERESRYDPAHIALRATADDGDYLLTGEKVIVSHDPDVGTYILAARTSGEPGDKDGITLFRVPARAAGMTVTAYDCVDGFRAADIRLEAVRVPAAAALHAIGEGWVMLEQAVDLGALGACAEGVGILRALNEATTEYMKTRQQFGVYLGQFQALQHRCVDMLMAYRQARILTMLAAVGMRSEDARARRRIVSAAKACVNRALRFVGQQAVHLHGGVGVTDELPVAHYFKRATIISKTWGDLDHHLERFIAGPAFAAPFDEQCQNRRADVASA